VKPYYEDDRVQIYCGDMRDIAPELDRVQTILTDPPYGISYVHGAGGGSAAASTRFAGVSIYGDDDEFDPGGLLHFENIIMWGANHYANRLPNSGGWLVWDKRGGMASNDQSDCELAWTNVMKTARLKTQIWNGMITSGEQRGKRRLHPTQKPVELMQWCLSFVEDPGVILDPFMGSGTTLLAAKLEGRRAIGIEKNREYCDIAVERLRQRVLF